MPIGPRRSPACRPSTIRALARRMAATRTMVTASWSLQRADHGEQPYWALILLAAALGQIGLPGGGFGFGYGSRRASPSRRCCSPSRRWRRCRTRPGSRSRRRASPTACSIRASRYDFNGKSADLSRHPAGLLGRRQSVPPPPGPEPAAPRLAAARDRSSCTSRGGPRPRATPTSCCRRRRRSSATISAAPRRDRFVIAMHKAIEPVGEARNDFDIFRDLAGRLGCAEAFTEGRDETAWLRHIYERWSRAAPAPTWRRAGLRHVLERGLLRDSRTRPRNTCCSPTSAPIRRSTGCARRRARSSSTRSASRASATTTARRIRPGSSRPNGSAATERSFPLHLVSSQPRYRLHSQMDAGPVSASGKIAGREAIAINPADARARGIADGRRRARLQRARRVFRRRHRHRCGARRAWCSCPAAPGMTRRTMRTDAPCAHGNANVLTRDRGTSQLAPRAELGDRAGRDRALRARRRRSPHSCRRFEVEAKRSPASMSGFAVSVSSAANCRTNGSTRYRNMSQ